MAIPAVTLTIQDGGLGQVPASFANASVKMGVCSGGLAATLYTLGDVSAAQAQLGQGALVEAVCDTLNVAGGPLYAMPLNPTTAGSVGSTTHTGTGAATVTGSSAPAVAILAKITTAGALGTMAVAFSVNGGAYGTPVVSTVSAFSVLVPGTLTTLSFADQTYTAAAIWTISTLGVITLSGTGTVGWVTQVSSPLDGYDVRVAITTGGALGTAVFTYSVDGNNNVSAQILVPSGGAYAIPGTGVVLTFSGTSVALDTYAFATVTAAFTSGDAATALAVLLAQPILFAWVHITGMGTSAAAAATLAGVVDSSMTAAEVAQRYIFGIIECPTSQSDSTVATAFTSFSSLRVGVAAGDVGHISTASPGRIIRRNIGVPYASRLAAIQPSEHPGWVGSAKGALKNVNSLYPNGTSTTWVPDTLDANRFITARKFGKRPGYYITRGNMMAPGGSDFSSVMNRRVMDVASTTAVDALLPFLNSSLTVNASGTIDDAEAARIEAYVRAQIEAVIVATGDAVKVVVTISRTEKILTTRRLPTTIAITPKGYAENIPILIGYVNPALTA